ncbi:MAG: MarR family winged helix-turn-helix transcriptional regulator [Janthinobacterium lividum]
MSQTAIARQPDIGFNDLVDCTCMRLRKASRRLTQIFDQALSPAGITTPQFGLLAYLHGSAQSGEDGLALGILAERLGMDPTTLNRNLKPLEARDFVSAAPDPDDRRVRLVRLTAAGGTALLTALPLWRETREQVRAQVGLETLVALNGLLDIASLKLAA